MKQLTFTFILIGSLSSFANINTPPQKDLDERAIVTPESTTPVEVQSIKQERMLPHHNEPVANRTNYTKTTNDMIRKSQSALQSQGYNVGARDGVLGSRTKAAIMDFQKKNSLQQTGSLNQETLEKLNIDSDYNKDTYKSDQYAE